MDASTAAELELTVLLADLQQREDELRHRVELSHRTFFVFLAVLAGSIAAFVAISSGVLDWLAGSAVRVGWLALAAAVMALWFPLNTVHQEVQIKVRELYLERELLPRIRRLVRRTRRRAHIRGPGPTSGILRWPAFEREVNTRRFTVMTVIRAAIVFLPSVVLVASWLVSSWPLAAHDTWIIEVGVAGLVVGVTAYCAAQAIGIVVERKFRQP